MNVMIKPMAAGDIREVLSLWHATEGIGLSGADTEGAILVFLARNPGLAFVARDDGKLIGAILCGHDGRRGYLHHLAVALSYRHRGVGRELAERCLGSLRRLGIQKCHLFVFARNTEAIAFWRQVGWHLRDDLCMMSQEMEPNAGPAAGADGS